MAKKKVSNAQHEKPSQKREESVKSQPMESPPSSVESEKVENLKSLNQMLLKEAVERRELVDSLVQSKGSLEMELTRSNSEKEALGSELARLGERAAELEVERRVVTAFVAVQVGEKGEEFDLKIKGLEMEMREREREVEERESEIARLNGALSESKGELKAERDASRRVRVERDVFEAKLKRETEEGAGLRANLTELRDKMGEIQREIEESRAAYNALVREREDMEIRIKSLMGEKDASDKGLIESNKLIEKMEEELSVIVREKEGVMKEKNDEIGKRRELENVVKGLNEMVASLQKEEAKLQKTVAELDTKLVEGEEKLNEMGMEMKRLVKEMKLSEKRIEGLVDEKSVIEKDLNEALKNLDEKKRELEGLANEKVVILEEKNRLEGAVGELGNHVDELKAAVSKSEESNVAFADMIRSLESQVGDYKCKLEKVSAERDGAVRCLNEEKQNALKLKAKIQELEKKIEESHKASGEVKAEKAAILGQKVELESRCGKLREEIASLQEAMVKSRAEFDSMKSKAEMADANLELVLNMLKGTSAFCSNEECGGEDDNVLVDGEVVRVHAMEMETIKKAFKSKAAKMEDMKAAILGQKVELESQCGKLREEIASLQEAMVKSRAEFDSMKSKAEMADANSELVLNMLKGTSAFCSKEEYGGEADIVLVDGEVVKVHAMEMETIRKAFKSKAAKVEDMKRQLEALQSCVVDEQKKKSFWTVLSSATTLLAAALSIAYVARGH